MQLIYYTRFGSLTWVLGNNALNVMEKNIATEISIPKLACIILSYNHADMLSEAIESVMMQKCDFPYKLIIMDDCSTDNSYEVAMAYQAKYPDKIQVVRNEQNLGLVPNTAKAYKYLKGVDYFCVLDCDDKYTYDKKFAEAVAWLDEHPDYVIYLTNVKLQFTDNEELCYNGKEKAIDFTYASRKRGSYIYIHTTGQTYRNIYFKDGDTSQFDRVLSMGYPQAYRSETHRYEWHLKGGKAHFVNSVQSIWNAHGGGLYSGHNRPEQLLHQIKTFHSFGHEFFPEEREFYFKLARYVYQRLMEENADSKMPEGYMERNKDDLIQMFNALFSQKALQNAAQTYNGSAANVKNRIIQDFTELLKFKKHYILYLKYKILKSLTLGIYKKYIKKEEYYHNKIRNARRIRKAYLMSH